MILLSPRFTISFSFYHQFLLIFQLISCVEWNCVYLSHSIPSCECSLVNTEAVVECIREGRDISLNNQGLGLRFNQVWILSAPFLILICLFLLKK